MKERRVRRRWGAVRLLLAALLLLPGMSIGNDSAAAGGLEDTDGIGGGEAAATAAAAGPERLAATSAEFPGLGQITGMERSPSGGYVAVGINPDAPLNTNGYMLKLNDSGEKEWSLGIGGDLVEDVRPTSDGGFVFSGYIRDEIYNLAPLYGKVSAQGKLEWSVRGDLGDPMYKTAKSIVEVRDGQGAGYLVIGTVAERGGERDLSVTRLDVTGNEMWSKLLNKPDAQSVYQAIPDGDGHYLIVGTTSTATQVNGYAANISGNGDILWEQEYSTGDRSLSLLGASRTSDGGFILSGGTLTGNSSSMKLTLIKTDPDGQVEWQNAYDTGKNLIGKDVIETRDGGYAAVGARSGASDDMLLMKVSRGGAFQWSKSTADFLYSRAVLQQPDGSYWVSGGSVETDKAVIWKLRVGPPAGLAPNDLTNTVAGLDETMEYSINQGASYTLYDPATIKPFEGDMEVWIRYKKDNEAGYEAGEPIKYTFTKNQLTVTAVEALVPITVPLGTPRADLPLPQTVRVTLSDGSTIQAGVMWDQGNPPYTGGIPRMPILFQGTLLLPGQVQNPSGLKTGVMVINDIAVLTIKDIKPVAPISAEAGTPVSSLGLPTSVEVTLSDDSKAVAQVTWDAGMPVYNGMPGIYTFTGVLTPPLGVGNMPGLKVATLVMIGFPPVSPSILEVAPIPGIEAPVGTELGQLGLPGSVEISLSNGEKSQADITWDGGTPPFDAEAAGEYAFTGKLTPPQGIANPTRLKASAVVTLKAPPQEEPVVTGITLDESSYRLKVGETHTTVVTAVYSDGSKQEISPSDLIFSSGKPEIAAVSVSGEVKGISPGPSVISVTYGAFSASAEVEVYKDADPDPEPNPEPNPDPDPDPDPEVPPGNPGPPGGDSQQPSPPPVTTVPVQPDPTRSVTGCADSRSCTASLGKDVTVTLPEGTVSGSYTVIIQQVTLPDDSLPKGMTPASKVYELESSIQGSLAKPAQLTVRYSADRVKEGQRAALFYLDESAGQWREVKGTVADGVFNASVERFAQFAVFAVDEPQAPAVTEPSVPGFPDVQGHWAKAWVEEAAARGLVNGEADGRFAPDRQVTRAEFAVMLMRALGEPDDESVGRRPAFADAGEIPVWAQAAITLATERKWVSGYEDGAFRPDASISRAEMTVMLMRALNQEEKEPSSVSTFADAADIPAWARAASVQAAELGLVTGREGNRFDPSAPTTRAEAAVILVRMLHQSK